MTWAELMDALHNAQQVAAANGGKVEPVSLGWNPREGWWLGRVTVSLPVKPAQGVQG